MLITISRQFGAGGSEVAKRVAAALGWRVVDNELVEQVAARAGLPPERVAEREERVSTFVERLARTLAAASPEVFPPPDSAGAVVDDARGRPGEDHRDRGGGDRGAGAGGAGGSRGAGGALAAKRTRST